MFRFRRPGPGRAGALLLVVLLAATAWVGVRALLAKRHLDAARSDLTTAREALLRRDVVTARRAIAAAGRNAGRARSLTSDPVWRLGAAVPGCGTTLATAHDLARAADRLANDVLPTALDGADRLDPARLRRPDGSVDIAVITAATPPVAASAEEAERVRSALAKSYDQHLLAPVARARAQLTRQVDELTTALRGTATALQLAPALLGEDRPRRYLLLVQQTGESRGTGGIIGGYVEVLAAGGKVTAVSTGSNAQLRNGYLPPPPGVPQDFVTLYGDDGAFELWQNVNLSPDLPVVAKAVESRWRAQGGQPLDGVGVLDGTAIADILRGSGPVDLPSGIRVRPDQIEEFLAVGQYRGVPLTRQAVLARKDLLQEAGSVAVHRLAAGGGSTSELLRGVAEAVRTGHLRFTSDDPALRPGLAASGVDGALPSTDAPFTYPVVWNATGGKLEHFLDRSVSYTAGPCTGARRRSRVSVTLTNRAPEGLPQYLTILQRGADRQSSRTDVVTLQVYATRGAWLVTASLDGRPFAPTDPNGPLLTNATEAGLPLWSTELNLAPDQPHMLVLDLDEPTAAGTPRVLEQPLARPQAARLDVPGCG